MNSPLVLLRFFLIFGKEGILRHSQVEFFFSLAGKADTNVIKSCALHINERIKESNSSEQRFVVVVVVVAFVQFASKNLETDPEYHTFYILTDCLSV